MTTDVEWIFEEQGDDRENGCRWRRSHWRRNPAIYKVERFSLDDRTKLGEVFKTKSAPDKEFPSLRHVREFLGEDFQPLFALAGRRETQFVEPTLAAIAPAVTSEKSRDLAGSHQAAQGLYLTASGSLTQFNGIMGAVHGILLPTENGFLKGAIAAALLLHVIAAFIFCWAAKPVSGDRPLSPGMALMASGSLLDDTFKNYQRGWRYTVLALSLSTIALGLVLARSLSAHLPTPLARLF